MQIHKHLNNRFLRRILILILIITVGGPIALFITYREFNDNPQRALEVIKSEADMVFKNIEQTATRDGTNEWKLSAKTAYLIEAEKKMILEKPKVEFFLENGNNVYLTAQEGVYRIDNQNIQVSGNVVVTQDNYTLRTERLFYVHRKRRLLTKDSVRITSAQFDLSAGAMHVDLTRSIGFFNHGVTGIFNENEML